MIVLLVRNGEQVLIIENFSEIDKNSIWWIGIVVNLKVLEDIKVYSLVMIVKKHKDEENLFIPEGCIVFVTIIHFNIIQNIVVKVLVNSKKNGVIYKVQDWRY